MCTQTHRRFGTVAWRKDLRDWKDDGRAFGFLQGQNLGSAASGERRGDEVVRLALAALDLRVCDYAATESRDLLLSPQNSDALFCE